MIRLVTKYSLPLFYMWFILVMVLSLIPTGPSPAIETKIEFRLDYLEHFLVFIPLGFLWPLRKKTLLLSLAVLVAASIIPELAQVLVPYRRFNPIDATFNILGISTGFIIGYLFIRLKFLQPSGNG